MGLNYRQQAPSRTFKLKWTIALTVFLAATSGLVAQSGMVYIADDGSTYHLVDCPTIKGIKKIVGFRRDQLPPGSVPCSVCLRDEQPHDEHVDVVTDNQPAASTEPPIVIGPYAAGPQELNNDTFREAISCGNGERGLGCTGIQLDPCGLTSVHVSFQTPFSFVANAIASDKLQLRQPTPIPASVANASGVVVHVAPGTSFTTANSVTRVVLERGGQRIEPIAATVTPRVYRNGFGATQTLNDGLFRFPLNVLQPPANVDVLIAVSGGAPLKCSLTAAQIRSWR